MVRSPRVRGVSVALVVVVLVAEVVLGLSPVAARPASPPSPATLLSPPEGAVPDLAAYGWQQVLNEDFSGSSVDESEWDVWDRDMFGPQTRQALSVSGGNLTMSTYTDPADGVTKTGSLSTGAIGSETPTGDGFEAAYGYFEVGDKAGTTDAFWLMTDNGNNSMPFGDVVADGPEIDVMEHGNGPDANGDTNGDGACDWNSQAASLGVPCNELLTDGGHWDGFEEDHKLVHDGFVRNPTATPLQNNFHTYSLLWTPGEYRIYVDGIETARSSVGLSYVPEHILLTTFAGPGSYGPLGNTANDHMVVDYVRVWQRPVSDVPDQATAADTPLAVAFLVQDYAYSSPGKPDPGTVTVTATSSDTTVVPNSGLAVAGDGIADPDGAGPLEATDGSFQNGDFGAATGWGLTGGASIASSKLQLTTAGGKATQTISKNTTYVVDANYDLALEFTDTNGNDRVDPGETFTDVNDKKARFDWGIQDVDSALAGSDSALSFDSVVVRPLIPAHRVVTIRPADGKVGQSTITLTAKNAGGTTIGTDTFVVTVGAGSLADGTFEAGPATTAWTLLAGAQLPVADPYKPDRQLLLAQASADTVIQTVTNLTPSTRYKLDVAGRVSASGGALGIAVQSFGGTDLSTTLTSTSTTTQSLEFVTGASNTSASVLLLDWIPGDGTSTVEQVNVSKCSSPSSCASLATDVGSTAPPVVSTSPRSTVSGAPIAIPVSLPSGATLTGITSTNQVLVPNPDVTVETRAPGHRQLERWWQRLDRGQGGLPDAAGGRQQRRGLAAGQGDHHRHEPR